MHKAGKQTWIFPSSVAVKSTGTVAGKLESEGPLGRLFDVTHEDDRMHHDTWEHAEQALFDESANIALAKANLSPDDIDLMIGGDLNAQLSSFYLGLRPFPIPALGTYAACATICESLAIGALCVASGVANQVMTGTSSHTSTAERQFRYPTEYGAQKPPTAQRTVTGAGVAVLSTDDACDIGITSATIGQVTDLGVTSPWEMGAAMAPAAASTILTHFEDTGTRPQDFDLIATGDLGFIGHDILIDLLNQRGVSDTSNFTDCGMLIYDRHQPEVFSGGSGGACCTIVTFAHLLRELRENKWRRILVSATGALLSTVTAQQNDTIPCVSHAIVFERRDS